MIQQIWVHFWDSFKNISNLEAYKQYFTQTVSELSTVGIQIPFEMLTIGHLALFAV